MVYGRPGLSTFPEECYWRSGAVTFADTLPASATTDAEPSMGPKDTLVEAKSICPAPQISMSPVLLSHLLQNNLIFNQGSKTGQCTSLIQTANAEFLALIIPANCSVLHAQRNQIRSARLVGLLGLTCAISLCYATIAHNAAGIRMQLKSMVCQLHASALSYAGS